MTYFAGACALFLACACVSDPDDKDMTMPFIEDSEESYPQQCEVYQPGGVIPLRCTFSDDMELGNYNVEIHNNFDHHTHSTVAGDCEMDEKKEPHKPWIYNQDYTIPVGQTLYKATIDIPIPEDIDEGDYHFMIRLTDRAGWQQLKSVSIKVKSVLK